jgi:endonuclease/exonuclease/phosphatase (EEP) superfamily protein YafD
VRLFLWFLALAVAAANVLAVVGFFARDRSVALALLLYLSALPVGLPAVLIGFRLRRTAYSRAGQLLAGVGLLNLVLLGSWMTGRGPSSGRKSHDRNIRLLHWNVMWGGLPFHRLSFRKALADEIVEAEPDLVVLSEAPFDRPFYQDLERLDGRRFMKSILSYTPFTSFFHIFISSRWPARMERQCTFANGGGGAVVVVDHPDRPIRLLVVDGPSTFTDLRTPMLCDIALACEPGGQAAAAGPVDLVVGDFNAVSRSIGFDDMRIASGGYQLASESCVGWRGTWPSILPVLDIDHVWVHSPWRIRSCRMFTSFASDHRAQLVELGIPTPD